MQEQKQVSVTEAITRIGLTIQFLFSRWLTILLVSISLGLLGILYAWLQKPTYIAEMSFTTESEGGNKLGAYAGIAAQFGFDLGGGTNNIFEGDNLAELFKSQRLIETTLLSPSGNGNKLMIDEYLLNNKITAKEEDGKISFSVNDSANTRAEDSLLNLAFRRIIKGELEVFRKDKKLSIIIMRMKSNNESFSKHFVELLAANAIQFYTDYKSKKSRQNVEILQHQTDSVRRMLSGSISDVAAISDLNVNPARQVMRAPAQRRQVDVQVNGTLYGELLKNLELAKLSLRKETPLIQVIDTPRYPLEKKKLGRLRAAILFAFIGGFLCVCYLLTKRYLRKV